MLYKYGGSAMWAILLYWIVAALLPATGAMRLAWISCTLAALVEFSRLHHSAVEDHFRATLAGRLLLGRYFGFANIAAYFLAILCCATCDHFLQRRRLERNWE